VGDAASNSTMSSSSSNCSAGRSTASRLSLPNPSAAAEGSRFGRSRTTSLQGSLDGGSGSGSGSRARRGLALPSTAARSPEKPSSAAVGRARPTDRRCSRISASWLVSLSSACIGGAARVASSVGANPSSSGVGVRRAWLAAGVLRGCPSPASPSTPARLGPAGSATSLRPADGGRRLRRLLRRCCSRCSRWTSAVAPALSGAARSSSCCATGGCGSRCGAGCGAGCCAGCGAGCGGVASPRCRPSRSRRSCDSRSFMPALRPPPSLWLKHADHHLREF
jgi:hypothetical protein